MKTTPLPRVAAIVLLVLACPSHSFGDEQAPGATKGRGLASQFAARLPVDRLGMLLDDQGKIHWRYRAVAKVREFVQAKAPDLVPGYDKMMIESLAETSTEGFVDRLHSDFSNASPEMRQRILGLVAEGIGEVLPEIEEQTGVATAMIREFLQAEAPDLVPGYDQVLLELAAHPGFGNVVDQLRKEWEAASPEARQRFMVRVGALVDDMTPEIGTRAGVASEKIRERMKVHAPDLVAGYDEWLAELAAEPGIESAVKRLRGEWTGASPELRQRIMGLIGEMAAELVPEMKEHAGEAAALIRGHLEKRSPDLVPGYDQVLGELTAGPGLENLVDRLGAEFENATPETRQRVVQLIAEMMSRVVSEIEGS